MAEKVYVLDTSVLMHDPAAIESFLDNTIVVPIWVLRELDVLKGVPGKSEMARRASRKLEAYRKLGSLKNGVSTHNHGKFFVEYVGADFADLPGYFDEKKNDDCILGVAYQWKKEYPERNVVIVSKDVNMRLMADALSLEVNAQDYLHDKVIPSLDELYTGIADLELVGDVTELSDTFRNKGQVSAELVFSAMTSRPELLPNQCCYLKAGTTTGLAVYKKKQGIFRRVPWPKTREESDREISPINDEQAFAYDLLKDPDIDLVTLSGAAGTGKTLIALLAGWQRVGEGKRYRQLVVYRPNIEVGRPLGFLPGDLDEKFAPWKQPIYDNLDLVIWGPEQEPSYSERPRKGENQKEKDRSLEDRMEEFARRGYLAILPINFEQGRTLHHRFVIVDEAQNLTPTEAKVLITRMGKGSKIVLNGDPEQIVASYVDAVSNGLTHVIESMKGQELCGHITMKKTERSRLVELAAELL